jgi:2'-5' RNA ligase
MRLYAVVVPPADEVARLFQSVGAHADETLTWAEAGSIRIGLGYFGNLTNADASRLSARLATELGQVEPLELRFSRGGALEEAGDDTVWVGIEGDKDELRALALKIAEAGRREGFLVDRRWYKPRARLAAINDTTTAAGLETTVARLTAYEGQPWVTTTIQLIEPRKSNDSHAGQPFDTYGSLQLLTRRDATSVPKASWSSAQAR